MVKSFVPGGGGVGLNPDVEMGIWLLSELGKRRWSGQVLVTPFSRTTVHKFVCLFVCL